VVRCLAKSLKTLWFLIFLVFSIGLSSGCSKNVLAGKSSLIDPGHLIEAPLNFNLISVDPGVASATVNFPNILNATSYIASYKLASSTVWLEAPAVTVSPVIVTGLVNGSLYDFKVRASNISGFGESDILQAMPNTLPDPFLLTTLTSGDSQLFLTWPTTTGIGPINYIVRYGTAPGVYTTTVSTNAVSPLTINGLTNGTTYYLRVFAANYVGETASLNEFSSVPSDLPDVPTGLTFAGSVGRTCSLAWTASTGIPPIVYSVKQAFAPTSAATSGTPVGSCTLISPTSCVVSGLTAGVSYNFSVAASNGAGSSLNSADLACNPVEDTFTLSSAAATSSTTVNVVYPVVTGATSYTTRYSNISGAAISGAVGCSSIAGTTCTITGLSGNTTYYFITTANSSSSSVTAAAEMSVLTPNPPTTPLSFTTAGSTGTTCLFNWLASGGTPVITYDIKRSTTPGASDATGSLVPGCTGISGVTSCSDTTMVAGTTYYYSMRATNGGGTTSPTSEVSCRAIENPFTITSVTQSNSRLTLIWPSVAGATAYTVRYGFMSGSYSTIASTNATSPFALNGLANGTTYYVMVTATNTTSTQDAAAEGVGTPFNSPPVANPITPASFSEDSPSTITLSYTDVENNNPLGCALTGMTNVTLTTPCACTAGVCTVVVTGTSNYNGAASFNYTLTDIGGVSNSAAATLTINPVNDVPVVASILAQSLAEDGTLVVNLNVSDIDSVLTCSAVHLSATSSNTSVVANSAIVFGGTIPNCTATITPQAEQNGVTNIAITVNDNGSPNLQDSETFVLTVNAVNDSPIIGTISNQNTNEDTPSSAIPFTITDVDNVLTCAGSVTATSGTTGLIANAGIVIGGTAPNCTLVITPVLNQNGGPVVISLAVTDGSTTTNTSFNMTVNQVDDPPVVSTITNRTINEDNSTGSIGFTITDADSTLNCTTGITKASSNTGLIAVSGIVTSGVAPNCTVVVTPLANQNGGPATITLGITDGTNTTNITFNVTVTSILDITSITLPTDGVYVQDQDMDFVVNFEDNVNVTGVPKLNLTVGSVARTADYVSGSGTSALLFRYTPTNISTTDDYDSNGIVFSSSSVILSGGTIVDSSSSLNATLTFTTASTANILVDARTYSYSVAWSTNHVNENVGSITATLTLTQAPLIPLTFPISLKGTAALGSDYSTTLAATMTVPANATTTSGTVTILDDVVVENSESIMIDVAEPSIRTQYLGAVSVAALTINASDAINYPIQIGQTAYSTCAINQLNKLFCTGSNAFGMLGVGDLNFRTTFTAVDSATDYASISTGASGSYVYSNCGITTTGVLKCWGYNNYGSVGDGTTTTRTSPVIIDGSTNYSKVSVGYYGACGITTTGVLKCWGYNNYRQVGDGSTSTRTSPVVVDSGTTYSDVVRGIYSTCGITTSGVLKCWGYNGNGTVGDGTTTNVIVPTEIDAGITYSKLANSMSYTMCAIRTTGALRCWGLGTSGQIGNGSSSTVLVPTTVNSGINYAQVSVSQNTVCAISTTGILKCWGADTDYNFGLSVSATYNTPQVIHTGESFSQVIVNNQRMCALNSVNVMKCSGLRQMGLMGDGFVSQFHSFTSVSGLDNFSSLSINGQYMSAGIKSDGSLYTWGFGRNGFDYPGDNSSQEFILTPIQVLFPTGGSIFTQVSKGFRHTCAIRDDQQLYCWGVNTYGNIGDNTTTTRPLPVVVDAGTNYISVSAGTWFTCGITSTGVLKCWGNNSNRSVGDGTTTQRNTPRIINSGVSYKALAQTTNYTMCAITTTDVLKCWGYNNYGQVGVGGTTSTTTPTIVDSGTAYLSVVASIGHTCGITLANEMKCWGQNSSYQLGDGTTTDRQLPVAFNSGTSYTAVGLNSAGLTCGITTAGALHCAGVRSAGLAASSTEDGIGQSSSIAAIDVGLTYTNLYSGYDTICGRTNTGATRCAGEGVYGAFLNAAQLPFTNGLMFGTGTSTNTLTPIGILP
jgi:alpha-tubulin suppressor-like RCC1 family protein